MAYGWDRKIEATVCLRRGEGFLVKENAEQIDGKRHVFDYSFEMESSEEGGHSLYAGRTCWNPDVFPERNGWPIDAPIYICEDDLKDIEIIWERGEE